MVTEQEILEPHAHRLPLYPPLPFVGSFFKVCLHPVVSSSSVFLSRASRAARFRHSFCQSRGHPLTLMLPDSSPIFHSVVAPILLLQHSSSPGFWVATLAMVPPVTLKCFCLSFQFIPSLKYRISFKTQCHIFSLPSLFHSYMIVTVPMVLNTIHLSAVPGLHVQPDKLQTHWAKRLFNNWIRTSLDSSDVTCPGPTP